MHHREIRAEMNELQRVAQSDVLFVLRPLPAALYHQLCAHQEAREGGRCRQQGQGRSQEAEGESVSDQIVVRCCVIHHHSLVRLVRRAIRSS